MDKNQKNEIKVGIVSIIGIIIVIAIIVFIKGFNLNDNSVNVLFIFDNSFGITSGSPIVVNGVKRGAVNEVWNANEKVYISATLSDIKDLKSDVSAVISILELTGGKKIEIFSGTANTPYNPKEPIMGINSTDLSELIRKIGDITENLTSDLQDIIKNVATVTKNMATVTNDLTDLLTQNQNNINLSIKNITQISSDLKGTINDNKPQIETIINNLEIASKDLNKILKQADVTFDGANNLITDVDVIMKDIKSNNGGTVSKLLYDQEFAKKLDSLVQSFDMLSKQILEYGINTNVKLGRKP
jgi:phospholipid/cholesterol/gamma-HCH transport system substrate-binding protein